MLFQLSYLRVGGYQIADSRRVADPVQNLGPAGLSRAATAGMAVCASRDGLGRDDELAEGPARAAFPRIHPALAGIGPQTRRAGHHAEIPLAFAGPCVDRKRAHPGESGALRRAERP